MVDKNLLKVNDHERTMAFLCLNSKNILYIIIDNKKKG